MLSVHLRIKCAPHSLGWALTPLRGRGLGEDHRCPLGSGDKPSPLASLTPALGHPGVLTPVPPSFPQVEKLVKYLDPNDLGRINFKDFCRGVFAMKGEVFRLWLALHIWESLFCVFPIEVSPSGRTSGGQEPVSPPSTQPWPGFSTNWMPHLSAFESAGLLETWVICLPAALPTQGLFIRSKAAGLGSSPDPPLSVCPSTGCEELLKDVLSVESAGTLPCAPEIPDCVEPVRGLRGGEGKPPAAHLALLGLLAFASRFWCQEDTRAPSEGPLASKSRNRF